jgi:acyl dehydratase
MSKNNYPELRRTYEEVRIGETASRSRTITERDIISFAELTDDSNPVHLDAEYAKTTHVWGADRPRNALGLILHDTDRHPPARY